ncbi:MAG: Potassium-transporting ATPase B chain [candidate division WS6 bacterium OLB20]|uniref:Potassium-transporting ATPase B chain n=1 Tax=candidate division WS6 bacterium OLB20 TaxID=1617426 RepID=A0A136LYJ2_9BACT|nr:MAG: Potassium-transporting ATPase B chain [candidate division WS6 bacterium OLB20]
MKYDVSEVGEIEINTIVFDLNGTLQVQGSIPEGVRERLAKLRELGFSLVFFTGDARGNAHEIAEELGIEFRKCVNGAEKEAAMSDFDKETTAAIGNARIDIGTFRNAKLAIGTLQAEGIHTGILKHIDVLVPSINDALDFFLDEAAFKATMRT